MMCVGLMNIKILMKYVHFSKTSHALLNYLVRLEIKYTKLLKVIFLIIHVQDMIIEKFALVAHTDFEVIDQWNSIYFTKEEAEAKLKELEK